MNALDFSLLANRFLLDCEENIVNEKNALSKELIGTKLMDEPIFGFASTGDTLFTEYQKEEIIGTFHKLPTDWLPSAKTVVSFFLPFTQEVKADNAKDLHAISLLWLHARREGQLVINRLCTYFANQLVNDGYETVVPLLDKSFIAIISKNSPNASKLNGMYTSNWSERHAAFACGLGTFGLSKGLITEKGIAGRFGSFITQLEIPPTKRKYTGIYDYCCNCGKCAENCPVQAISLKEGKSHKTCSLFVDKTEEKYYPYYGCGKCQVSVPCQNGIT